MNKIYLFLFTVSGNGSTMSIAIFTFGCIGISGMTASSLGRIWVRFFAFACLTFSTKSITPFSVFSCDVCSRSLLIFLFSPSCQWPRFRVPSSTEFDALLYFIAYQVVHIGKMCVLCIFSAVENSAYIRCIFIPYCSLRYSLLSVSDRFHVQFTSKTVLFLVYIVFLNLFFISRFVISQSFRNWFVIFTR